MKSIEEEQQRFEASTKLPRGSGGVGGGVGGGSGKHPSKLRIKRTNIHYEGALVACSKLGLWEEAFQIYIDIIKNSNFSTMTTAAAAASASSTASTLAAADAAGSSTSRSRSIPSNTKVISASSSTSTSSNNSSGMSTTTSSPKQKQQNNRGVGTTTATSATAAATTTATTTTSPPHPTTNTNSLLSRLRTIQVTDGMILSIIKSCIRGCKKMSSSSPLTVRRIPLDECRTMLLDIETNHGLPLTPSYVNPLAAAYQSIGLIKESNDLLNGCLSDRASTRKPPPPPRQSKKKKQNKKNEENGDDTQRIDEDEDDNDFYDDDDNNNGIERPNINHMKSKDKASYGLLVKSAITQDDYASAVERLSEMTDAGLYPDGRYLNIWTEVSERKTKNRYARSRKKKRDESWLESVQ